MRIAATVLFAVLLAGLVGLAQTQHFPAVDVSSSQLLGALDKIVASGAKTGDTPIRMIDAGGYNVGVGVLYRAKGISPSGSSSHDRVTEIFELIEGSGTLITGADIVKRQRPWNQRDRYPGRHEPPRFKGRCRDYSRGHAALVFCRR